MKLKLIVFSIFILLIKISHAQNLVSNPDFETFTNCPIQVAELFQAEPWIAESTPDYFNRCAVFPTGSPFPQSAEVPVNYYGDQEPLSGDAYAGYAAGEYITGVLIEPLIAGECYYAEYYVNRAQPAFLASLEFDDFYTFFSEDIPEFPIPIESFQLSQINFSVNSEDWALISGSFTASGGEQYITINVRDDYHFVDDFKVISMETDTQEVFLCDGDCYTFAGVEYCTTGTYETTIGGGSVGACEETIILKINSEPPGAVISTPIEFDCADGSYLLKIDSGATTDMTYEWSNSVEVLSTDSQVFVYAPGRYYLKTFIGGCVSTDSIDLNVSDGLELTTSKSGNLDCNNSLVTLSVSSAIAGLSYTWTGPGMTGTGPTIDITQPGEYVVAGISTGGICSGTDTIVVEENLDDIEMMITKSSDLNCENFTVTLEVTSATSDLSYSWTGPDTMANGPMLEVTEAGEYIVIGTDADGVCSGSDTILVEENLDDIEMMITKSSDLDCENITVTLEVTSAISDLSYSWTGPGTTDTGTTIDITQPGEYVVAGISTGGICSGTDTIIVEENLDDIEMMITKSSDLDCENFTVTLEVTSAISDLSYSWTGPGTTDTGTTIDITQPGEYVVAGISTGGICSGTDTIFVEENLDDIEMMITKSSDLDCENFTVTLEVTSAISDLSYSWTGPDTIATGPMIDVTEAGEYIVIGTDAGGVCSGADTIMVVENYDDIEIVIIESGDLNCNNSEVVLQATSITGGVSYSWSSPDTTAEGEVLTITEPGEYTVMGNNLENTCVGSATIVVTDFIPIAFDYDVFQPNCNESGGSIIFNTELSDNYQHSINGGVDYFDVNEFEGLLDGVYKIMVKDNDGCESEIEEVIINIYEPLSIILPDTIKSDLGGNINLDPIINFDESIIASISWSPSVDATCDTCLNTLYNVNESLLITLEILTNDGCIVLGKSFIALNKSDIYIPNVFSPLLRDGTNDYLIPYTKESGNPLISSFAVYDRWGNIMYKSQNAKFNEEDTGWDGTFNGKVVNPGVYVYYIIVLREDGSTDRLSGNVSVL